MFKLQVRLDNKPSTNEKREMDIKMKPRIPYFGKAKLNRWTLGLLACGVISLAAMRQADAQTPAPAPATNAPTPPPYGKRANESFIKRFDQAELEQAGTASNPPPDTNAPPAPTRRIGSQPFDSPPYPDGDWQLGG